MTIIMVGIVQIFATVTQTASDAEGAVFAQEQARAFFDRLHNELRGMTREGYLRIMHNSVGMNPGTGYGSLMTPAMPACDANGGSYYSADSLAFITIGAFSLTFPLLPTSVPANPSVAEVVYTNNVKTDTAVLQLRSLTLPQVAAQTPRRGILARGQWLFSAAAPGTASDLVDLGMSPFLCTLFALQPKPKPATASTMPVKSDQNDRMSVVNGGHLIVKPWIARAGTSDKVETLKRVLTSCTSEFYVEVFDPAGDTGSDYGQARYAFTPAPSTPYNFYWSTIQFPASTPNNATSNIKTWPRALRVTIAVHDPSDTKPPETGVPRFRGYAFQEIFWIADP